MKLSKLIEKFQETLKEKGDIDVGVMVEERCRRGCCSEGTSWEALTDERFLDFLDTDSNGNAFVTFGDQ